MALTIFEQWGVKQDADFGNIVFNLVESGMGRQKQILERTLKILVILRSLMKNLSLMGNMIFGSR